VRFIHLVVPICLAGCSVFNDAGLGPENALGGNGRVNLAGANQMLPAGIESFDNPTQLAAAITASYGAVFSTACTISTTDPVPAAIACVDNAAKSNPDGAQAVRNGVTSELLLASDQRCNLYFAYLTNLSSAIKATSSALGTVFGGIGTIINTLPATRIFSGLSGMSSGVGGNLDSALFQQVAISVIVPAIQKARDAERTSVLSDFSKSYADLPLGVAMDDVIHYHGLCNLNNGISFASKAIAAQP